MAARRGDMTSLVVSLWTAVPWGSAPKTLRAGFTLLPGSAFNKAFEFGFIDAGERRRAMLQAREETCSG